VGFAGVSHPPRISLSLCLSRVLSLEPEADQGHAPPEGPHPRPRRARRGQHSTPHTLPPTPYTLPPTPYTLPPTPSPYILYPSPYTLHPTPYTLHSTPYTVSALPFRVGNEEKISCRARRGEKPHFAFLASWKTKKIFLGWEKLLCSFSSCWLKTSIRLLVLCSFWWISGFVSKRTLNGAKPQHTMRLARVGGGCRSWPLPTRPSIHCCLSLQRFDFGCETFHSQLLSRWAALSAWSEPPNPNP